MKKIPDIDRGIWAIGGWKNPHAEVCGIFIQNCVAFKTERAVWRIASTSQRRGLDIAWAPVQMAILDIREKAQSSISGPLSSTKNRHEDSK